MNGEKGNQNKEIIIGLVVLILLSVISLVLIVKRELPKKESGEKTVVTEAESETAEVFMGFDSDTAANEEAQQIQEEAAPETVENVPENITMDKTQEVNNKALFGEYYTAAKLISCSEDFSDQLKELYYYWNDYQLDAVDDLIHLPRVRAISKELSGTNHFYYYGDVNQDGKPNGGGVAVYADDTYYCGEWSNGKRSGKGMWLQIFPDELGTINGVSGVEEHSYNGTWANDYPNGEGQEHYSYVYEKMDENIKADYYIANVIGGFKDGYYDGELYIMTADADNTQVDWSATAKKGQFEYIGEEESAMKKRRVWEKELDADKEDEFMWMLPKENINQGIFGLKKK